MIRNCGLRPDELAGLFLVGGSSRLPLAARMLHSELGIAPTVLEQPELPVAEGALAELLAGQAAAVPAAPGPRPRRTSTGVPDLGRSGRRRRRRTSTTSRRRVRRRSRVAPLPVSGGAFPGAVRRAG